MEIVIDIPEDTYKRHKWRVNNDMCTELDILVANGTPLPKGHGRLIDADKLKFYEIDEIGGEYNPYLGCSKEQVDQAPTIIKSDKED